MREGKVSATDNTAEKPSRYRVNMSFRGQRIKKPADRSIVARESSKHVKVLPEALTGSNEKKKEKGKR